MIAHPAAHVEETCEAAVRNPGRRARRRGWLIRRLLLGADLLGLCAAFAIAELLFGSDRGSLARVYEVVVFLGMLPVWVVFAKLYGLYDADEERTDHTTADDVVGVFHLITVGTWFLYLVTVLPHIAAPQLWQAAAFWAMAFTFVTLCRGAARAVGRQSATYVQKTVIVGAGNVGSVIARKLLKHPEYRLDLVGFVDDVPHLANGVPTLGALADLPDVVVGLGIERVVIGFVNAPDQELVRIIRSLKSLDVQIDIVPRLHELVGPMIGVHTVEGLPLLGLRPFGLGRSSYLLKRTADVVLSVIGLVLLAPLFAVVAAWIKLDSRGPVFFRQERMGRDDVFQIIKFRTMVAGADAQKPQLAHLNRHVDADPRMFKIRDDPRVTRCGRFLRRYFLDELPQLLNVAKGEMSLVGPRPLILNENSHLSEWARTRLDLKPGMTGLWQVLGRSALTFDEMIKLDYLYVTSWTLGYDFRLLLRTIPLVVKGGGGRD